MMLKILFVVVMVCAIAVAGALWLGARLPVRHRIGVGASFRLAPERLFDTIADIPAAVSWRRGMKSSELLDAAADGTARFRQVDGNGAITYRIEASERPKRFVTRIDDLALPFGGTWTISIAADGDVTKVTIVEDGEIRSSLFRFFARYVFGYYRSAESYLAALGNKFGEQARIERMDL